MQNKVKRGTRLSPFQWLALAVFLFFYGFTVFALTRDYYLRHPPQPPAAETPPTPHGAPQSGGTLDASAIPEAILEQDPNLLHQRADERFIRGQYAEAVPLYERILELGPEDAEVLNDLGLALHYMGDTAGAISRLQAAVGMSPELQRPWLTLGFVNLQAGKASAAKEALEHARDLDPDSDIGQEAERLLGLVGEP